MFAVGGVGGGGISKGTTGPRGGADTVGVPGVDGLELSAYSAHLTTSCKHRSTCGCIRRFFPYLQRFAKKEFGSDCITFRHERLLYGCV